jgi:hypothetical protein
MRAWVSIACAVVVWSSLVTAQQGATFDVASVKPNRSGELMIRLDTEPGGRFLGDAGTSAARRSEPRLAAGAADAASAAARAILAGGSHRDARVARSGTDDEPIGRLGPRLTRSKIDCAALIAKAKPDDGLPACGFRMSPGSIVLEGMPVSQIASGLSGLLGRRIVDRTGLTGNFDLQLHWDPPARARDGSIVPNDTGVSLFTALGDQAELKLTEAKLSGTVLVIDSVQRPAPN